MLEEVAAMAATFLLLTVLVQVSTAMTARSAADAAVAAATRRAALPGADLAAETDRLRHVLGMLIPGVEDVTAHISAFEERIVGRATIRWSPPGPVLTPITITVGSEVIRAFPP